MSGVISISTAVVGLVGAGVSIYSANKQAKMQEAQMAQQQKNFDQQVAAQKELETSRPQASKAPDVEAIRRKAAGSALTGPSSGNASTYLTGASGIDDSALSLGKSKLLGQ